MRRNNSLVGFILILFICLVATELLVLVVIGRVNKLDDKVKVLEKSTTTTEVTTTVKTSGVTCVIDGYSIQMSAQDAKNFNCK